MPKSPAAASFFSLFAEEPADHTGELASGSSVVRRVSHWQRRTPGAQARGDLDTRSCPGKQQVSVESAEGLHPSSLPSPFRSWSSPPPNLCPQACPTGESAALHRSGCCFLSVSLPPMSSPPWLPPCSHWQPPSPDTPTCPGSIQWPHLVHKRPHSWAEPTFWANS